MRTAAEDLAITVALLLAASAAVLSMPERPGGVREAASGLLARSTAADVIAAAAAIGDVQAFSLPD